MKRLAISAFLPLALAGCATMPPLDAPAADYRPLDAPGGVFDTPEAVVAYYARQEGFAVADAEVEVGRDATGRADRIVLFTLDALEDDSVSARQYRIALTHTDIGYRPVAAGQRFQCARGSNAGEWTRELCP